ncbi:MAG: YitT family protein [bacterium]|nr:YitT family protein [bacterium]
MIFFHKKKDFNELLNEINKKNLFQRYCTLIFSCFITALAFNVFFLKYKIVCFGVSGLSIIMNEFGINPSLFIFIVSVILLIISYFALGWEKTKNSIIGSLLFPIFVTITEPISKLIDLGNTELIVVAIFGAIISGIGYGLIYKNGFTTGGTDIINQILNKYFKISIGNAILLVDGLVVLSAKLVFSWEIVMYGYIVLYIISTLSDKVILGISQSKAFYIVTEKEAEVKKFLLSLIDGGVTIINAKGGYSNHKQQLFLCVIPTKKYFIVKEGLQAIDKNIFFLVTDSYEVSKRKGELDGS